MSNTAPELRSHCVWALRGIYGEYDQYLKIGDCYWDNLLLGHPTAHPTGDLGCPEAIVTLLRRLASHVLALYETGTSGLSANWTEEYKENNALVLKRINQVIDNAYRKFYAYKYDQVPLCWRILYTEASSVKFCFLFHSWSEDVSAVEGLLGPGHEKEPSNEARKGIERQLDDMIHTLDRAIILAGAPGDDRGQSWIDKSLGLLERVWQEATCNPPAPSPERPIWDIGPIEPLWNEKPSFSTQEKFTPKVTRPVPRVKEPSREEFMAPGNGSAPMIFTGLTQNWLALKTHPWSKPSYLLWRTFGGRRLVPVEVGRSYVDEGWGQKLVKFGDFMRTYIEPNQQPDLALGTGNSSQEGGMETKALVGYLAQYHLLNHLPELYRDIDVPDLCFTSPSRHPTDPSQNRPKLNRPLVNVWFGPGGTISPLHTDPYHNLLVQVVGRKYVRLYAPWYSRELRPRGQEDAVDMSNTSSVDVGVVEGWDVAPAKDGENLDGNWKAAFEKVPYVDCILEPGETLHIPIGWWHYVRSLSVSFSVSFWWN